MVTQSFVYFVHFFQLVITIGECTPKPTTTGIKAYQYYEIIIIQQTPIYTKNANYYVIY
jgi:hypothetical protein